jgi:hypothetical protein
MIVSGEWATTTMDFRHGNAWRLIKKPPRIKGYNSDPLPFPMGDMVSAFGDTFQDVCQYIHFHDLRKLDFRSFPDGGIHNCFCYNLWIAERFRKLLKMLQILPLNFPTHIAYYHRIPGAKALWTGFCRFLPHLRRPFFCAHFTPLMIRVKSPSGS